MKKRLGAGLLSAVLLLGLLALPAGAVGAPAAVSTEEAAQVVNALGIMVGNEYGDMMLGQQVTRAEFITMAVKATPNGDQVGKASTSPYPDVPYTHWAAGYVEAGVAAGLIHGYSDGTFRPGNQITLAEGATIALQLLGYTSADFSGAYPTGQMAMYRSLKLDRGVTAQANEAVLTRQDTMYLFYNLLSAKNKAGTPYLETLGYSLNAAGQVDRVSLINSLMEGPVTASGSWKDSVPFDTAGAKVYRGGKASSLANIQPDDVVYWNTPMRTLWVYSDKITGAIQTLSPSASSPTSVQVAGQTYQIETSSAAYALSDLGAYGVGDTVTLLLGRDGKVAAVAQPGAGVADRFGVVTALTVGSYTEGGSGPSYTADTVTMMGTDGKTYSYQWNTSGLKVGKLVRVSVAQDGSISLRGLSSDSLSGKVSSDGKKLGGTPMADDVEILDAWEGYAVRVYPSRLAGISLTDSMVSYYSLNSRGEIDRLILNDVTGDMHRYGVLTNLTDNSGDDFNSSYSYRFDLGGVQGALPATTTRYPVKVGPIQVRGDVSDPKSMLSLTAVNVDEIGGGKLTAGNKSYTLSDNVLYYEYRDNGYFLSTLSRVQDSGKKLTGWYDKAENQGGRIRVVLAK